MDLQHYSLFCHVNLTKNALAPSRMGGLLLTFSLSFPHVCLLGPFSRKSQLSPNRRDARSMVSNDLYFSAYHLVTRVKMEIRIITLCSLPRSVLALTLASAS